MGTDVIGQPAYQRVAADLREQITRGLLVIGDPIPSTARICAIYQVSSTVARAAVSKLRAEGVVQGQPGKAVYVIQTPATARQQSQTLDQLTPVVASLSDELEQLGLRIDAAATIDAVNSVRVDVDELRRQVGVLQAQLIDLYGRTGNTYPREGLGHPKHSTPNRRRGTGTA